MPKGTTAPTTSRDRSPASATLAQRYAEVTGRMADAAAKAGRRASDIILVAVTKTAAPEQIRALMEMGHRDFGENRVQMLVQHAAIVEEYLSRQRLAPSARRIAPDAPGDSLFEGTDRTLRPTAGMPGAREGVRWHMIGHLQRNKARKVTEFVRLIHSVDSLRLAEELQQIAVKREREIEVLLQVNCSGEAQKFGCPIPAAIPLAEQIGTMMNIRLRGLMTMAAQGETPSQARSAFARCRELFEEMRGLNLTEAPFNLLSMGMSGDFEAAIAEGANIVRVGTAIFGEAAAGVDHPETEEPDEDG